METALRRLRAAGGLSLGGVRRTPLARLENLIRASGYFRQKARSLKSFLAFLDERYGGSLACMFSQPPDQLRQELLTLPGIGPETADSILLYAGQHPVLVVDAYTRRILHHHGLLPQNAGYEEIRQLLEPSLSPLAGPLSSKQTSRELKLETRNQKPARPALPIGRRQ